ncbi:centrosome-associated protein CEP250-like isoform X2 [Hypanus sabinus]|uniref:centrosome-associated protein CEP250-like isoform X2 n=1 Tax=Hypanus sabinus TaxID=79690 RepID=UPI0028C4BF75|nr:centrosome-associated protein CEP250-like isoform X2 [Hypanus sabinus]
MMGSKLEKTQSGQDKRQDSEDSSRIQLEESQTSQEQLLAPPEPEKREYLESFPGEQLTDLNVKTLQEHLIKLKEENKYRGDRIAKLEDYILKLVNLLNLAESKFKGSEAVDNQKILEEKLKEYVIQQEARNEEAAALKKKLNEMQLSCHQLHFECDALKGKLASVKELESLDSHSSDEEGDGKHSAKVELLQRVKNLEGLLKLKDMNEKELTETVKDLEAQLLQSQENQRQLSLRCAKMNQLTKQKEDIESKLEERYNQVEQLQIDKENSEEEYQEQIKILLDEIKERDEADSQLEMMNKDLLQKNEVLEECRNTLELKIAKLKMDLEERVNCELKLKKQCSDLEKTIRDWEHFEQQMNEQFKQVEKKKNNKIKDLKKQLMEKDEVLRKALQAMEELKKSAKNAESMVHERHEVSPEVLKEKAELEAALNRKTEAEVDQAGFNVKIRSRFEMELSAKSKELEHFKDEAERLTAEICELQEQQRQQKESERKLQERNRMLEGLIEEVQEGETRNLQEKIARMEKLLIMKEETEEKFQARISNQESLLKEMEETQGKLAQRNEELGAKQRGMNEELHRWKIKCSNLERFEREVKVETRCQRDKIKELEIAKTNLEAQLQKKISEFNELDILRRKEQANVTAELNKKIEDQNFQVSVCQAAKQTLEMQLKKKIKELEISEASIKSLKRKLEEAEENQCEIRKLETILQQEKKVLETQLAKESQIVITLEATVKEDCQQLQTLKGDLHRKEAALQSLQEEHSLLLARVQDLEQELEEAKKDVTQQGEGETKKHKIDDVDQRLEDFIQSEKILRETIGNFAKTEAALKERIQDLESSKQKLLDKISELTSKSQQLTSNDSQLIEKLRCLQLSERNLRNVLTDKESTEEMLKGNEGILKGKLCRLQNQLRMKVDEMNKQSEYFEHYKQRQQQLTMKLRERELSLQNQLFKLEREKIDLSATSIVLKSELHQVTAKFTKLEKAHMRRNRDGSEHDTDLTNMGSCLLSGEDHIKEQILVLQNDLKSLLEKEAANNQEREQFQERLQQAEENESFLTHKLEDFRSRIHELKLSESSLQEQIEDLEEENEKLRKDLKEVQEQKNYLNVLDFEEKLGNLAQDESTVNKTSIQNCELQFSSGEMSEVGITMEASSKYKHLSSLCNAVFQHMEDESSPNRYRELKNSLTHLRSQLQNGDILFREELMQQKWTAVLDSARNKNTQTPSVGQCLQEAMILAKLASECTCDYPKLSEAVREGWLNSLLQANSCTLAELMQIVRTGDVEEVRTVLRLPETQRELGKLLSPEVGRFVCCDLSSPMIENQETRQSRDGLIMVKESVSDAAIPEDTITIASQPEPLDPGSQEVAKLNLLSIPELVDCNGSDAASCTLPKTPCSMKGESVSGDTNAVTKEVIANLKAEVGELQEEKAEMDRRLQCVNNQLLDSTEEKRRLEDELYVAGREVNHLAQKLEALTKGKIQEEESMKNNLRKENEVLEKRNKELLNEITKLQTSQQAMETEFEQKREEYLQKISQLKDDKKKMEDKFNCMQQENAEKLIECHQSIETLSTENGEMKGRLSELKTKDKILNNMVTELKEKVEKMMKENEHLLNKIDKMKSEKTNTVHETIHHLTKENEHLLGKVRELENELENYSTANTAAQYKINQIENANTNLMNVKENLIKESKVQGEGEINEKPDELQKMSSQQSDVLLQEATGCENDRKIMLKAKKRREVEQSKNSMEHHVEFNDVLSETSTVKITGRSNEYKTLSSKENAEDESPLSDETRIDVEAFLEEIEMEGDSSPDELQMGYDILPSKSQDADQSRTVIKAQLTNVEGKNQFEERFVKAELELKSKQTELDETKAKAQKWHSEAGLAEDRSEKIKQDLTQIVIEMEKLHRTTEEQGPLQMQTKLMEESVPVKSIGQKADFSSIDITTLQQQIVTLNSQLKDQIALERKLQELQFKLELLQNQLDIKSKAEMDLKMKNYCMKGQIDALAEHVNNAENFRAKDNEMKSGTDVFERLQNENANAKLLIAPLKAKLSCLIQKCLCRNSLIVHLVRELYQRGLPSAGLIEEAEDMLNDTAILEYTRMFLPPHCQQRNLNNNSSPAGISKQDQECCRELGLSYPRPTNNGHSQENSTFPVQQWIYLRACVATADYHPNPNMPHTVLPVLSLSAGDIVYVTGMADSHGMYPAEVNGRLGLVPVAFVEEMDKLHHLPSCRMSSPGKTKAMRQPQSHKYQVTSTKASPDSLSTPAIRTSQLSVSRLHNEMEYSNFKAQKQATEKGKEQLCPSKFAEQFYCSSEDCFEMPYDQAYNDASDLKSIMTSRESDTHVGLTATGNLSDRCASNHEEHSKQHPSGEWRHSKMEQEPPAPVGLVRITDRVGQNGLMVVWEKPSMDEMGCSNGTFVQGYRIFINGEFHKSVTGSICTKVVLEDLDLNVPFQVSVQTVGVNGLVSEKVQVPFLNCRPHRVLSAQSCLAPCSQATEGSDLPEETRFTFRPLQSKWRKFIAIYDYNPLQDSPNIHPSQELAFKEGDTIWVYGKQRRDGFCEAEVHGRRGLVPICFLEDTSIVLPQTLMQKTTCSIASSPRYDRMTKLFGSSEYLHKQNLNK